MCHGDKGKGDGPNAKVLQPKPRDLADTGFQASNTNEMLAKIVIKGGEGVGKSSTMPATPELEQKPEVVKELVEIIRSFAR